MRLDANDRKYIKKRARRLGSSQCAFQHRGDAPASPQDRANKNATASRVGVCGRDRRVSAGRRRGDGARHTRRGASGARSGIPRRRNATRIDCGWRGRRRAVARREAMMARHEDPRAKTCHARAISPPTAERTASGRARIRQDSPPTAYMYTPSGATDAEAASPGAGVPLRRNRPHADKAPNMDTPPINQRNRARQSA